MRAGWQPRLIPLQAVARGEVQQVRQQQRDAEEEPVQGIRRDLYREDQVHHAQGGPAVVEEGRRHGLLVGVVGGPQMAL